MYEIAIFICGEDEVEKLYRETREEAEKLEASWAERADVFATAIRKVND